MRGCLFVVIFAAVVAVAGGWFGGPALAGLLIQGALGGAGFDGQATSVRVIADPPIGVLTGRADRIEISARDATFSELEIASVELTLEDVDLAGRRFASARGTFTGVLVRDPDGDVPVERIELSGPSERATAIATLTGAVVEGLATERLRERVGLPIGEATLHEPDVLSFSVLNQRLDGRFTVEPDGALSIAAPLPGNPRIVLFDGDPVRVEDVTYLGGKLLLTGTIDLAALIGG